MERRLYLVQRALAATIIGLTLMGALFGMKPWHVEKASTPVDSSKHLFDCLHVTWEHAYGAQFLVRGESNREIVSSAESVYVRNGSYRATLPCMQGETYKIVVIHLDDWKRKPNRITFMHNVSPPGLIIPGTRFTQKLKHYESKIPTAFYKVIWRGAIVCNASCSWRDESPYTLGAFKKLENAISLPLFPSNPWYMPELLYMSKTIAGEKRLFFQEYRNAIKRTPLPGNAASLKHLDTGKKALHWCPRCQCGSGTGGTQPYDENRSTRGKSFYQHCPWVDFVECLAKPSPRQLQQQNLTRKPWLHFVGDSTSSGLVGSLLALTLSNSSDVWGRFKRTGNYMCKNFEPLKVELEYALVSWILSGFHGGPRVALRNPEHYFRELGLSDGRERGPDVLFIQSGLWDIQEWEEDGLHDDVSALLLQLRRFYADTHIIWLGPLSSQVQGKSWRLASRLERHVNVLRSTLRDIHVPFIDATSVFSGLESLDGRHYPAAFYLDWANLALNEVTLTIPERQQSFWQSSFLQRCSV